MKNKNIFLIFAAIILLLPSPADARRVKDEIYIAPQEGRVAEITEVAQWYAGMYDYVMSNYEPDSLQHRFFKEVQNPKAWVLHSEWGPSLKLDEIEYCIRISKMTIQELLEEYNDLNPDHFVHQYIGQTLTQLEGLYFREHLLGRTIGRINSYDDTLESMPEILAADSFFEEEALLAKKKILLFREWAYRHWNGKPKIVSSLIFNLSSQDKVGLPHDSDFPKTALQVLSNVEPIIPGMEGYYLLQEPNGALLTFLVEELKRLPFNDEVGQTILMRDDAKEVIDKLIIYIERNIEIVANGGKWNVDSFDEIRGFFQSGYLETFKNEIYEDTDLEGIGYNIDLGINYGGGIIGNPSEFRIKLERYCVQQNPFRVTTNGSMDLHLLSGAMVVDLSEMVLSQPHTPFVP